ncbi:hypothetical protein [Desulfatibacillum aliphaticivorans]|uniref:hypothetical protein n=1 Tax=Desulfatibacillum aliphaticivorans TaxID=218208 RepID=UPI00041EB73C|nr:hypothetical protein [Desulfatibacillum aliphaticivorans]
MQRDKLRKELNYLLIAVVILAIILFLWQMAAPLVGGGKSDDSSGYVETGKPFPGSTPPTPSSPNTPTDHNSNAAKDTKDVGAEQLSEKPDGAMDETTTLGVESDKRIEKDESPQEEETQTAGESADEHADSDDAKPEMKPDPQKEEVQEQENQKEEEKTSAFETLTSVQGVETSESIENDFFSLHNDLNSASWDGDGNVSWEIKNSRGYMLKTLYPYLNMKLALISSNGGIFIKSSFRDFDWVQDDELDAVYPIKIEACVDDHEEELRAWRKKYSKEVGSSKIERVYYVVPKQYCGYFFNKLNAVRKWHTSQRNSPNCMLSVRMAAGRLTSNAGVDSRGQAFIIPLYYDDGQGWKLLPGDLINQDPDAAFFIEKGIVQVK